MCRHQAAILCCHNGVMPPRLLGAVLLAGFLTSAALAALSDHVVRYDITARLDPAAKTITGHETLTWHNESPDAVPELRFHLYLNAFQNERSTFIRESGGQLRGDTMAKDDWGYIEITRMQLASGRDLTHVIRFVHPDDNNADDQTVIAVPLPESVPPGRTITLGIDFLSKLPKVFARTGYHEDFFMVGQWFPKIGVYEKAGDRYAKVGAWNLANRAIPIRAWSARDTNFAPVAPRTRVETRAALVFIRAAISRT